MSVLVVYESMWGNTREIAHAIAAGLAVHGGVEVLAVVAAPPLQHLRVELLVVGAPTHSLGLSRPRTRDHAYYYRGGQVLAAGVREWLDDSGPVELAAAVFDTQKRYRHLLGSASANASRKLRRRGCTMVTDPKSFYVEDYDGPLLPAELDRAREWGAALAEALDAPQGREF